MTASLQNSYLEGTLGLPAEVVMVASLRALLNKFDRNVLTLRDIEKRNVDGRILHLEELEDALLGNLPITQIDNWQRSVTHQGLTPNPGATLNTQQTDQTEGIPNAGITVKIEKNPRYAPAETEIEVTERRSGGELLHIRYRTKGFGYSIGFITETPHTDGSRDVYERGYTKNLRGIKMHDPRNYKI